MKPITVGTQVPILVICKFKFYVKPTGTINICLIFFDKHIFMKVGFRYQAGVGVMVKIKLFLYMA